MNKQVYNRRKVLASREFRLRIADNTKRVTAPSHPSHAGTGGTVQPKKWKPHAFQAFSACVTAGMVRSNNDVSTSVFILFFIFRVEYAARVRRSVQNKTGAYELID